MDADSSNVIGMSLKHMYPLQCVVVEHSNLHIVLSIQTTFINVTQGHRLCKPGISFLKKGTSLIKGTISSQKSGHGIRVLDLD